MPFIKLSVAKKISNEMEQAVVDGLGKALSVIPGKDPQWTMVEVNDGMKLYFGGKKQEDMVFADVKYVCRQEFHKKRDFTRAACKVIHDTLGTPIDRICLTITEYDNWGAVGDFRDQFFVDET